MKKPLWQCAICDKEVKDKGKGFRVFIKCPLKGIAGEQTTQIRICEKCLKTKNYSTINL